MSYIDQPKAFLLVHSETIGDALEERLKRVFQGCNVATVNSVEEALEALEQQKYHAAFIEIRLGEAQSLDQLKSLHYSQVSTPLIGVVPRAMWGIAQDLVRYGVVDLLEKDAEDDFALRKAVLFACCRESGERERFNAATRDPVTGLVNQEMMLDRLRRALRRGERNGDTVGFFYIDISDFKKINDTFGKVGGDTVLKNIAERMIRNVRCIDTVARMDSDEFAVVLEKPGTLEDCLMIATGLRDKIQQPYALEGVPVSIEITIGVGLFPDDERHFEDLLSLCRRRAAEARQEEVAILPVLTRLEDE